MKIYPYARRMGTAVLWSALTFLGFFFIRNSALCSELVFSAAEVCIDKVIPSLFPYMVISSLVISSGLAQYLGRVLSRPLSALFALSGSCAAAVILGVSAGFPIGAKVAVDTYKRGLCTKEEAERLCCFCNNTGPAFLIGGIGTGFFGDMRSGVRLYVIQLISVLILGLALSIGKERRRRGTPERIHPHTDLPEAVKSGVSSLLYVCGFVIFFAVINGAMEVMLTHTELKSLVPFLFSLSEVTSGAGAAADIGSLPLAAFAVGWSGACVHAQSAGFMLKEGLSMKKYLIAKLAQGCICALLCVFWQNV